MLLTLPLNSLLLVIRDASCLIRYPVIQTSFD